MGAAEFPSLICFSPQREQDVGGLVGSFTAARFFAFQGEDSVMDILTGGLVHLELYFTLPITSIVAE